MSGVPRFLAAAAALAADRVIGGRGDDTLYRGRRLDPLDHFTGCVTFTRSP